MANEITEHKEPVTSQSDALMAMAKELATNPQADVDKLQQIINIAREARREEAETAFNDAMTAAQTEMGRIKTNQANASTKSRYADYASLDKALRPLYTKHGFALSFNTAEGAPADTVRVVCLVSRGGFTRPYQVDMPADGKGAKGGDVMTKTHATGAAMTYGMRYLLKMIFNVAIGEDDTDGNMPGATITSEQADELKASLDAAALEVEGKDADYTAWTTSFLGYMKVDGWSDIPVKDFDRAKKAIISAKAARAKK